MKAKTLVAILAKRFGVRPPGWEAVVPTTRRSATSTPRRRSPPTRPASAPSKAELKAAKAAKG